MSHKLTRSFAIIMVLVMIATGVLACTPAPTAAPVATQAPAASAATNTPAAAAPAAPAATDTPAAAAPAATGKTLVGLSFSDFATERWKGEQVLMQKLLEEKGYSVVWQEANHDPKLQNDQIDNMVTQGAKALIIIAEDGDAAATAVDKAVAAGVKVIAYDRLIKSTNISAYISFNNTEVGRQEALGVVNALKMDSGKWTKDNPVKMMLMGGSPTDNNAILVRQGQLEVVQPWIDKGLIKVVADQWVDNWDAANALKIMENVLTAQNNKIDAVVASNDGTALGALQALKAQKLAGVVPISGQDATADGCNSIVKGEQTVSVYKDTRLLSPLAVKLADELLKGQSDPDLKQYTMAELTNDKTKTGNIMADFLPVVQVTKDNVYDLIVKSGFQSYDDVYRDIPDAQRPPKPGEAAAPAATAAPAAAPAAGTLVGLSFSDFATERWKGEQVLMQKLLEEKGYKVVWQEANHDPKLQNDQIDNMVTQGAKALIIIAEDGDAAATAVDKAVAAGVKVIAYDRLIKSTNISAYISFNNTEVGRQEALGVVNALKMDSGKWTADNPVKMMLMGGSPTDNNAILVRQGQLEVVQPWIDKGLIKVVADQWVDNWDAANALKIMENVLTAQNNKIDAVVASNDGTALGALQALKAQKLAGVVPISGQDATADGCNSIVKGEQTVSVYKDTRLLSPLAVKLADELLKGQSDPDLKQYTMAELTNDKTKTGNVMADFLPVVQVTKDNVYDLIVKSGFQSYDDVYRDIPADQRPPKPGEAAAPAAAPAAGTLVGLSFSDFATERWKGEQVLMQKLLEEKGYKVVWQEANHDPKLQNDQIDNMVTQGAKALIVIAEDGDAAATAVDKAAAAGVKVIAYDRLIKSTNIGAYISFNNTEVGRQEALGVVNALKMDSGKWTKDNPVKMMLMGGSPTDNNAILVRQGQLEVVQPWIDKGLIKVVADQWVDNWDAANALKIMENVLTAQNNKIDAVVASNDGTALGALQALKAQKLAGVVPISGQDATADGCNSIVKGEQTVSVYKDTRLLSPLAVKLVDEFLTGQSDPELKQYTMAELTNDKTKTGNVMADFLPVVQVTKDNVYDLIVKSGFQSYDDVYRDIPADQRPPKP